jgi:hypothetical protein
MERRRTCQIPTCESVVSEGSLALGARLELARDTLPNKLGESVDLR